jgi:hypothetical protein
MVPTRRTAFRAVGSTTLAGIAGCLGLVRSGHVDVRVDNGDDRSHAVDVAFRAGGEVVAEERVEAPPGTETTVAEVVDAGEYAVTVILDDGTSRRVPLAMNGCTDNALFVSIDADAALEAGVLDEC